jgi:predicted DCC family thiol-disulfide oxidoreductase YuxK
VAALRIFPQALRDAVYTSIARSRYRVFGRHDVCDLGGPSLADRIIVDLPPP